MNSYYVSYKRTEILVPFVFNGETFPLESLLLVLNPMLIGEVFLVSLNGVPGLPGVAFKPFRSAGLPDDLGRGL